ncbi:hypothetical protein [Paracoccus sp. JM45]|uniref:hypothetical protein n=1 Tax=Paracoccus sp. JM45 TaxID=2283626 RepID=UPI000E6BEE37|nr:hypothetical protein [Paracoccus sp. JM45]RJE80525.1 hypothetical protein DWB67_06565 [Paracoccus sp. JM45]
MADRNNNALYFIVGGIVVVVAFLFFFMAGGEVADPAPADAGGDTNISVDAAPEADVPAETAPAEPAN